MQTEILQTAHTFFLFFSCLAEVGMYPLFDFSWKIDAQCQSVVAGTGEQVSTLETEQRYEAGFGKEKCSKIMCACLANGRQNKLQKSLFMKFACTVIEMK